MSLSDFLKTDDQYEAERRAEIAAGRRPFGFPKGPSRLETKMAEAKDEKAQEKTFLAAVHKRDGKVCRCCGRKVIASLTLVPNRREVHHIYGRLGAFRFDANHALQLCAECHGKVTGAVGVARLFLFQIAKHMVKAGHRSLIDARKPVEFRKAAA